MSCFTCLRLLGFALLAVLVPTNVKAQTELESSAEMASQMAAKAHVAILEKVGSNTQYRVAVFPFGDSNNKVSIPLGSESLNIQGELIFQLRKLSKEAGGKYFVLDKAGLAREFQTAALDPAGVNPANPAQTAEVLQTVGLNAGQVGAMQFAPSYDNSGQVEGIPDSKANVESTVVFDDGNFETISGDFDAATLPEKPTQPSGRFNVEMIVDGEPVKLVQGNDPVNEPEFHNVYFAVLPHSAKGKEYTLRITNRGEPAVRWKNADAEKDKNRLYGVAVKVDGINTIYQKDGNDEVGPVAVHPKNCRKWILCAPGSIVEAVNGQLAVRDAVGTEQDGSSRNIPGFQRDNETALVFTLATPKESIAETVGITNSLGLIEAHFYPQELSGDSAGFGDAGTMAGRELNHGIVAVKLDLKSNPAEVWRIFYRYEGGGPVSVKPLITQQ